MGEQFLADLRNPFRNVTVSRKRALQLFAAAIAVVAPSQIPQSAEARKHRKPPQAFVAGVLADAGPGSPGSLDWTFHGVVVTETGSQFKLDTPSSSARPPRPMSCGTRPWFKCVRKQPLLFRAMDSTCPKTGSPSPCPSDATAIARAICSRR